MSAAVVLAMALASRSHRVSRAPLRAVSSVLTRAVDRILSEQRRLKEEEKNAEALLMEYQQKASEAFARLSRIYK